MSWVKTNHVKCALRGGRPTAGAWLHLCSAISAEIMSRRATVAECTEVKA